MGRSVWIIDFYVKLKIIALALIFFSSSLQRPGMPLSRVGGPMGSMGGQLPGPSYGGGNMPMRPGMGPPTMDPSRKRFLHQHQQQQELGGMRRGG